MEKKDQRPKYEPPVAKDMCERLAEGAMPPCAGGGLPNTPKCNPGSAPASCVSGRTP